MKTPKTCDAKNTTATIRLRLRPLLRITVYTAMIALSSIAAGHPATANAEWDIGAYDDCMGQAKLPQESAQSHMAYCCITSGGQADSTGTKCVAPPANAQGPKKAPTSPGPSTNRAPIFTTPPPQAH